jgi:chemotaxis-related protein WspB
MLLFHLGKRQYAIPVSELIEVTPQVRLQTIVQAPDYVAGLFNYRGQHVSVIDLGRVLKHQARRDSFTTRTILVEFPLARGGKRRLGLLAEQVTETIEIDPGAFRPTGLHLSDAPYLSQAAHCDADVIQQISTADLLPESVQEQPFSTEAG